MDFGTRNGNQFNFVTPPQVKNERDLYLHIALNFKVREQLIEKAEEVRFTSLDSVWVIHEETWFPLIIHPTTTTADIFFAVCTRLSILVQNKSNRL